MSSNELTAKLRELKEMKAMVAELEAEIDTIEDEIKAHMTENETEEMIVDMFKVRYTTVKSSRFDTTAFKKTHVDLYEQYTKLTTTKRFSIA